MSIILSESETLSASQIDTIKADAVALYLANNPPGTVVTLQLISTIQGAAVAAYLAVHPGTIYTDAQINALVSVAISDYIAAHPGTIYTDAQIAVLTAAAVDAYIAAHPGTIYTDAQIATLNAAAVSAYVAAHPGTVYTDAQIADLTASTVSAYIAAHPGTIYTDAQIAVLTAAAVDAYIAAHPGTIYTDAQIATLNAAAIAAYVLANPCPVVVVAPLLNFTCPGVIKAGYIVGYIPSPYSSVIDTPFYEGTLAIYSGINSSNYKFDITTFSDYNQTALLGCVIIVNENTAYISTGFKSFTHPSIVTSIRIESAGYVFNPPPPITPSDLQITNHAYAKGNIAITNTADSSSLLDQVFAVVYDSHFPLLGAMNVDIGVQTHDVVDGVTAVPCVVVINGTTMFVSPGNIFIPWTGGVIHTITIQNSGYVLPA